ncbi:AraC-type DNA-binding protein [Dyadobacter sp. SG02]|uniref:helix-turn-helix domain-containing protein n=1 Tax=Dyadobacter sp. SG02 TaxID=1855291 RepID=UPI0008BF5424|nr:helix-turn-helix domain-containing protein [Dyadobacter sp. SG02]SEI53406.1 AraC-type DNA-binding protein [Dyadobacter sp. SG02]
MRSASQPLHPEADLLLVQAIPAGESVTYPSSLYRIIWVEPERKNNTRSLFVVPPGSAIDMPLGMHVKGYVLSFPEEFLLMFGIQDCYPFLSKPAMPGLCKVSVDLLNCPTGKTIERTMASLNVQCQRLPKGHLLLSGLLKILLVSVSRMFQQPDQADSGCVDQQLVQRFMHLVAQHDKGKLSMRDYARALSMRIDVLSETIKRVTGHPASHHIHQHIIRTAKYAAIGSGSTMKEVAYGLGFKDVAHFSKFFRNKAGMTFSDYKKAYQVL